MEAEKYRLRELSDTMNGKSRMQNAEKCVCYFLCSFCYDLMFLNEFNLKL